MTDALAVGATIGILGGGQLGRMLAMAAARLGYNVHIFDPDPNAPAGDVARSLTTAAYDDVSALEAFATSVQVVTYEFENVPAQALDRIEAIVPIHPNRRALATSQDRLTEKEFLKSVGLTPAPYAAVETAGDLAAALASIGTPSILKTRRMGYDGKGQARLANPHDAQAALAEMAGAPSVLEGFIDFSLEISVIAARNPKGEVVAFDPGENHHEDGILRTTRVPAPIGADVRTQAMGLAETILIALDYVGIIGVELFVTSDGLIVNEFAPRVHNSGHWTEAGCVIDQFEMHIRAIAGLPLLAPMRHSDVEMTNIIGGDMDRVPEYLTDPKARLHLYGKSETRQGRKMGHVTHILGAASDS